MTLQKNLVEHASSVAYSSVVVTTAARLFYHLIALLVLISTATAIGAAESERSIAQQRKDFLAAEQALQLGQQKQFQRLMKNLQQYPLYPYLRYQQLKHRISRLDADEVTGFMRAYPDAPVSHRLYRQWLRTLAKQRHWKLFAEAYTQTRATDLRCYYRRALLNSGRKREAFEGIEKLWLVGRSQPQACDPLFAAWRKTGGITETRVWQRFALAMQSRQLRLARYLVRLLPGKEQRVARLWLQVDKKPDLVVKHTRFNPEHAQTTALLTHGLLRLVRKQQETAISAWDTLKSRYPFTDEQRGQVERKLALALVTDGDERALPRLWSLAAKHENSAIREWRVRAALSEGNWYAVLESIERLSPQERQTERWRYWQARALEKLDFAEDADKRYRSLAKHRDYYGFLAADRAKTPYSFEDRPVSYSTQELQAITHLPGVERASELLALNRLLDARREWNQLTAGMDEHSLQLLAKLAQQWQWHGQAILTLGRTSFRDDLELRFPIKYDAQVARVSHSYDIDVAWVYAVMRRESAFVKDARSPRGALGLMQLMPRTGREVAKRQNILINDRRQLLNAETNIQLGTAYLRQMMNRLGSNPVLTIAAYNMGQYRVRRYLPSSGAIPADIWVETLPIKETRAYLRAVLAYTAVYELRLGLVPTPLWRRMPDISSLPVQLSKKEL
ncbi:MAG: transglycosylase SLT domain-containing protein [Gammaproteobacteria bacterium]|nr:transglycosylase SLT domain-containing protein [Gammaproteobacteria bacterium]